MNGDMARIVTITFALLLLLGAAAGGCWPCALAQTPDGGRVLACGHTAQGAYTDERPAAGLAADTEASAARPGALAAAGSADSFGFRPAWPLFLSLHKMLI